MSLGAVHRTVSPSSTDSSAGAAGADGGAFATNRKIALTAPQLFAESFPRTKTVCRPSLRPVVSIVALAFSLPPLKAPSTAVIVLTVAPSTHGGVSM